MYKVLSQRVSEGGMRGGGGGGLAATPALCQLPAGPRPAQLGLITAWKRALSQGLVLGTSPERIRMPARLRDFTPLCVFPVRTS